MADIIEQLKLHEGVRLKPYKCSAGKWTIGVGHNYEDTGLPKWLIDELLITHHSVTEYTKRFRDGGFTMEMADRLLADDVAKCEQRLMKYEWYNKLDDIRKRVIIDMTFNMGIGWIGKFKNTVKMIKDGNYKGAGDGMMKSVWAKQVGKRAERLSKMMKTGEDYDAF